MDWAGSRTLTVQVGVDDEVSLMCKVRDPSMNILRLLNVLTAGRHDHIELRRE